MGQQRGASRGREALPWGRVRRFLSVEVKRMLISFAQLPNSKFNYFDGEGNMQEITTEALCKGKKV